MKTRIPKPPELHATDVHVGGRLRLQRMMRGMSQEELAHAIGLTFQQVQKYETGRNRISAGLLWRLRQVLDVPLSFFFEDIPPAPLEAAAPAPLLALVDDSALLRRESLELMRAWYRIADIAVRRRLFAVIKAIAAPAG